MNVMADLNLIAPLLVPCIAAGVILLLTVAGGPHRPAPHSANHLTWISLIALGISGWLLAGRTGTSQAFSGAIVVDGVSVLFGLTAIAGGMLSVVLSAGYLREHELSAGEFLALLLLAVAGMLMLTMAGDLMTLFIGIETMSIAIYVLAGYRRASRRSQEAALKYFVYGSFASAFILFGTALLYGQVGEILKKPGITFAQLTQAFASVESPSVLAQVAIAMVLCGLAFKVAAVPFHMWAPDVYEGAPTPATGFMAVGVKAAAFAGICRFLAATLLAHKTASETTLQFIEILAIATMVTGNFMAIRQKQLKRMLAYSSIAHAGYLLVAVAAWAANPTGTALSAMAYYLLGYTAITLGAFGVALSLERHDDRRSDLPIERLAGLGHRYPVLGMAMALFMFALAGIPPTAGFFGKLAIFSSAIDAGRIAVVVVAVLASAVGAYYYLRIMVLMYMKATDSSERRITSSWVSAGLWACAAITLVAGTLPEKYLTFAKQALVNWIS